VTQKDKTPLALGQKVLVIAGNQARVVPDYTVAPEAGAGVAGKSAKPEATAPIQPDAKPADAKSADAKPTDPAKTEPPPAPEIPAAAKQVSPTESKPGPPAPTPDAKPAGTLDHAP
jgi:outer membrane lipoprotein SlyB